jgi:hypothetical protein
VTESFIVNTKLKALLGAVATLGLISAGINLPAFATGGPTISIVDANDTLAGSSISGYGPSTTLRMAIIVDLGTVSWNDTGSGAQLVSNNGNTAQGIWLEGTQGQLNSSLADISVIKPCAGTYKLYAQVTDSDLVQNPLTGHLYKEISQAGTWAADKAAADATPLVAGGTSTFGYLATVTTPLENILLSNLVSGNGWVGASDAAVDGDWKWVDGPENGTLFYRGTGFGGGSAQNGAYENFNIGEPNNYFGAENYGQIQPDGFWNDNSDDNGDREYTIEWGGMPGDDLSSVVVASASLDLSVQGAFSGNGTKENPYLVPDAATLHAVADCGIRTTYFKQTADITLPTSWAGDQIFKGQYDGNGKKIIFGANTVAPAGSFGIWAHAPEDTSSFKNMDISGDIDAGQNPNVALLYGEGRASISDSTFSGSIHAAGDAGGIGSVIGVGDPRITNVSSTVDFSIDSSGNAEEIGGIVGSFGGFMDHATWDGTMTITGDAAYIGGITGDNWCSTIGWVRASGSITVSGNGRGIGGLVGYFCGDVHDSISYVNITASNSSDVGGVGAQADGNFYRVAGFGNVIGGTSVGGLFGHATNHEVRDAYSTGNVSGSSSVGSIAGTIDTFTFANLYSTGSVGDGSNSSQGPFGTNNGGTFTAVNWDPGQIGFGIPMFSIQPGQLPYGPSDQVSLSYYQNEGWEISGNWADANTWTMCPEYQNGTPFLTGLYGTSPCLPDLTNATAPVITGTGVVGKSLGLNKGNWDAGVAFTYQWKLDGNNIAGATAATYKPVAGDVGKTVTVELTGSKSGFKTSVKLSTNNVVVTAAPTVTTPTEIAIGEFAGDAWWIPLGFVAKVKAAVKSHNAATSLTCVGIVAPGGRAGWLKKLGLKRATLACAIAKSFNSKLKTKLDWRISAPTDKVKRGSALKFNK